MLMRRGLTVLTHSRINDPATRIHDVKGEGAN